MAKLIYLMQTSLDGYIADETGNPDWAPDAHDVSVAGPNLAAQAIRAGLVDENHLLVVPMIRGGGKRVLPSDVCVKLDLLDDRRFANGMVHLRLSHAGLMEDVTSSER